MFQSVVPDPFLGTIFDSKYRLEAKIGLGGFGAVYRATHLGLNRPVAVKILHSNVQNASPENLERFRQEGISACSVAHPNAVSVLDFGVTTDSYAYLVMELLNGHSLSDELQEKSRLSILRCAEILPPVCDVLTEAHLSGIIHRDIKPDNIFLHRTRRTEIVKVLDFGIAKLIRSQSERSGKSLTATGILMGTPEYMAPERIRNKTYDGRSDVYSLGVILYQMLCGRLPFESPEGDFVAVMWMQVNDAPPPLQLFNPDIPPAVERVVLQALEKSPDRRPTAEELAYNFLNVVQESAPESESNAFGRIFRPAGSSSPPELESLVPEHPAAVSGSGDVPLPSAATEKSADAYFDLSATLAVNAPTLFIAASELETEETPDAPSTSEIFPEKVGEIALFAGNPYVTSVAFSPDGRFFLSARRDHTIVCLSAEDGSEIGRFAGGRMIPIRSVAICPHNQRSLFSGGDNSLRLRNLKTGEEIRRFFGQTQVATVGFSFDGVLALTGGQDKTIRIWETATGREVQRIVGHQDAVASAVFSADGKLILSMTAGGGVHLWRVADGAELHHLPPADATYDSLSVMRSDDLQRIVGSDITVLKPGETDGRRRAKRPAETRLTQGCNQVAFSPNGRRAASVNLDFTIQIWNVETGRTVMTLIGHGNHVNSIAFSPDGKRLISGSDDHTIRLWDAETGREIIALAGHTDKVHRVAFHPNGAGALSCSYDGTIRRWGLPF
jgi:eukaryotic-like serine/threonine-protein kinase